MTRDVGGEHRFELGQRVKWQGIPGVVISLTVEPSVCIEFDGGDRLDVGQSVVEAAPETDDERRARILAQNPDLKAGDYDLAIALGYEPESWKGMWKLDTTPFTYMDGHIIAHEYNELGPLPVVHEFPEGWSLRSEPTLTGATKYEFVSPADQKKWAKRGGNR
jgi:hypothetical protein